MQCKWPLWKLRRAEDNCLPRGDIFQLEGVRVDKCGNSSYNGEVGIGYPHGRYLLYLIPRQPAEEVLPTQLIF